METGQIFYISEFGDSDQLPEDIDDSDKHIEIPHKNELNLGKPLLLEFAAIHIPDDFDAADSFFRKRGTYAKFKNFLNAKELLAK